MLTTKEKARLRQHISLDNDRVTDIFNALADPTRCKLFRVFTKQDGVNVGEAASVLKISVPLASQHLRVLENTKLLTRQKIGREVFYKVNSSDPFVNAVVKAILP